MDRKQAIQYLGNFVKKMCEDGVTDSDEYREWLEEGSNLQAMEEMFEYVAEPGKPPVTALVNVFFHPRLDLIGINYTKVAFVTLHQYKSHGWNPMICQCRGIVFNSLGELVALPFPKFFNDFETEIIPEGPFEAAVKYDGELGIAYWYKGRFRINTRGTFTYKTAKLAQVMLDEHSKSKAWSRIRGLKRTTLLFEVIHPDTHKIVDYGHWAQLVLIGAFSLDSLDDFAHSELVHLSEKLGVDAAEVWSGNDLADLRKFVADPAIKNREGFVARLANGERVKFKFRAHVQRMREQKLSYAELMKRFVVDKHEEFLCDLPEEIVSEGRTMLANLLNVRALPTDRERRAQLYSLVALEELTSTYKGHCGKFLRALAST